MLHRGRETEASCPVAIAAVSAGTAWVLANAAKAIADRPRALPGDDTDAVLRQHPAHGTSFPSSHTADPPPWRSPSRSCRSWPACSPRRGSPTPSWWAGPACTWGCTRPWTSWPELALEWRIGAGPCWPSGCMLRRAGRAADGRHTSADYPGPRQRPRTPRWVVKKRAIVAQDPRLTALSHGYQTLNPTFAEPAARQAMNPQTLLGLRGSKGLSALL